MKLAYRNILRFEPLVLPNLGASSRRAVRWPAPPRRCLAVLGAPWAWRRWRKRHHVSCAATASGQHLRAEILRAAESGSERDRRIARGLEVLDTAVRVLGPEGLVVAFNGGKDATVVLHLARAARAGLGTAPLRVVYLPSDDEFEEVDDFVLAVAKSLGDVELRVVRGGLGAGLQLLCAESARSIAAETAVVAGQKLVLGFVLGTKVGDPNGAGQGAFEPSSCKYPAFWRVNPILHWSYADVWHFLRHYGLPYCGMYDRGYTSIGQRSNTAPNPALQRQDGSFAPAYELVDGALERAGRVPAGAVLPVPLPGNDAGLLVIGDEVLKGLVQDRNAPETSRRLRALGIRLQRIAVLPDDETAIATELQAQSRAFDFVVTSGGLGPTHDDVTLRGVGRAFGMAMAFPTDERFTSLLQNSHGMDGKPLTPLQRQQLQFPVGHVLHWLQGRKWPVLQVRNVFVLPGPPAIFAANLQAVLHSLVRSSGAKLPMQRLRLALEEPAVVESLRELSSAMPSVLLGSYPAEDGSTTLVVEAESAAAVGAAVERLVQRLPGGAVISVDSKDELPDS